MKSSMTPANAVAPPKTRVRTAKVREVITEPTYGAQRPLISTVAKQAQNPLSKPSDSSKECSPKILFNRGSDTLTLTALGKINRLADYLRKHPETRLSLKGHTDRRGTDEYNNVLAQERAKSVYEALIALGVEQTRIHHGGYGSSYANGTKGDFRGYAADRRVEITVHFTTAV